MWLESSNSQVVKLRDSQARVTQGSLLSTMSIWGLVILCWGWESCVGVLLCIWDVYQHLRALLTTCQGYLAPRPPPPPVVTTKTYLQTLHCSVGAKTARSRTTSSSPSARLCPLCHVSSRGKTDFPKSIQFGRKFFSQHGLKLISIL